MSAPKLALTPTWPEQNPNLGEHSSALQEVKFGIIRLTVRTKPTTPATVWQGTVVATLLVIVLGKAGCIPDRVSLPL